MHGDIANLPPVLIVDINLMISGEYVYIVPPNYLFRPQLVLLVEKDGVV